jgi:hypothetical protein
VSARAIFLLKSAEIEACCAVLKASPTFEAKAAVSLDFSKLLIHSSKVI